MTWLADHPLAVLTAAWLILLVAVLASARWLLRYIRGRRAHRGGRPRPLAAVAVTAGCIASLAGSVLVSVILRFTLPPSIAHAAIAGKPAPPLAFELLDEEGSPRRLHDYEGQVVLVNFWATWCAPCLAEQPALDQLQQRYAGRGLVVLQLSQETAEELRAFLGRRSAITVHGRLDDTSAWPVPGVPTTFVIDRDGIVRDAVLGARSYAYLAKRIERCL